MKCSIACGDTSSGAAKASARHGILKLMKFTLITLASLAVVLGIITYFSLFFGPQIVQPNQIAQNSQAAQNSPQSTSTASSTATSSAFLGGGGAGSTTDTSSPQVYQTTLTAPYPITWTEGQPQLAIMGATLQDDQLVLNVNIQMGAVAQCVPINLRLITDEQGNMLAPNAPATQNFPLAPDGTCQGNPQSAYSENVTFTVNTANTPFLFSTGDPANAFFEIATTSAGGLQVIVPQKNG